MADFSFNNHNSPNTFSIAAAPSFPGLRRFPEGRGFKQWTGDDSKALMKVCNTLRAVPTIFMTCHPDSQVYLPAIAGHVPAQMVRAISSFMEFCYLVHRNVITEDNILAIDNAVAKFHIERSIFDDVRPDGYSLVNTHSFITHSLFKNLGHRMVFVHR